MAGLLDLHLFLKEEIGVGHLILRNLALRPLQRYVAQTEDEDKTHENINNLAALQAGLFRFL